ncbi:MAG: FAD-dependent oxidoreductase [Kiritimatiellae bacterium]|nr:FAD-dependent oxidoreductase [Kiritimatiellia bacterium]
MNKMRHYTLVAAAVLAGSLGAATFDVAVVGGGPAGIGAALASAKTGAKTVLVERDARLGGTTVSAEVLPIGLFHAWNRQVIAGPCWDLVTNSVDLAGQQLPDFPKLDPRDWWHHCVRVNPTVYSALAAETLEKAGVELRFNAAACGIEKTPEGWKLALATDEGICHLAAKEVVDATGNAVVAAFAGAERMRADDAQRQPGSFFFHLNTRGWKFDAAAVDKAHAAAVASGELLPTDIHIKMSDYIYAGGGWGCYVPLADNSTATARADTNRRGRETMLRVLRFIRRQPGLEKAAVVSASPEVGVRETYRIVGEKTVTEPDYLAGTVEPDTLCYSYWYIDEHNTAWKESHQEFHEQGKVGTIPLGAMIPRGVAHLLVAGRAVSSDHGANSALRVQASCMAIGQSAGVVAALAAKRDVDPRAVPIDDAKRQLKAIGAIVP